MVLLSWLQDWLCPVEAGRATSPLICAHVYSYWTSEEAASPARPSPEGPEAAKGFTE